MSIQEANLSDFNKKNYCHRHVGVIVLSADNKIILQQRPNDWRTFPGYLSTFGGKIEKDETPIQALVRELSEELGAKVSEKDVISLGVITEAITNYDDLIYLYFWHDKQNLITGCYECEAKYYSNIHEILAHPKLMDDVRWALKACEKRRLLNEAVLQR